jgi:hypothetical protein
LKSKLFTSNRTCSSHIIFIYNCIFILRYVLGV